jgi:hypothetical protein
MILDPGSLPAPRDLARMTNAMQTLEAEEVQMKREV